MKRVVESSMVAHLWANQSQSDARSSGRGNVFFTGDTIYSYGTHFPIARHVRHKGRVAVLFTTRSYSVTTSGHCSMVRVAIRDGVPVFRVFDPSSTDHKKNLENYGKSIADAVLLAKRAKSQAAWKLDAAQNWVAEANAYAEFFGLKTRFTLPDADEVIQRAKDEARKADAANKRKAAKAAKQWAEEAAKWISGERDAPLYGGDKIFLRVRGSRLQTSRGAVVELADAKRLLPMIRAGRSWERNGQVINVGQFSLDKIDEAGNVVVGCHTIERAEIDRIAALLNL